MAGPRRELDRTDRDDLHYNLRISVWVRWFLLIAWLLQFNYRPNFADPAYIPTMLLAVSVLALNGYVHYRIQSRRTVTWRWALALSVMDGAMITAGIAISSSGFQNTFFVLYYPALAMFAVVFTSFRLSFAWVTMVAVVYGAMSLVMEPGVDYGSRRRRYCSPGLSSCTRSSRRSTWSPDSNGPEGERQWRGKGSFSGSGLNSRRLSMTPSLSPPT